MQLSPNARRIMDMRYSRKDEEGRPTETPEEVVARVAGAVADTTLLYAKGNAKTKKARRNKVFEEYFELLWSRRCFPNSPTWTGAGTPLGQLSACFVLPISDDLGTDRQGIFSTLRDAALIQQTGGGNGFDFSRLRPRDAVVRRSMGRASGPVGFMDAYDACFLTIAQGGSRRGANMGVLRADHPDVRHFINAKIKEGKVENFNISVAATDDFMAQVAIRGEFDLVHGGKVYETIKAYDLFQEIAEAAWAYGDPGLLFIDRANRDNPCPLRYAYEATNPCGEQWLPPYGSCNLGSIALQRFVRTDADAGPGRSTGWMDWDALAETIHTSVRFLDDIIDANAYVEGVPELEEVAKAERRIGLGYMGVADAMAMLGVRYGSQSGADFVSQVTEFLRFHAMKASIERAAERGPFPWIEGSIYDPSLINNFGFGGIVEGGKGMRTWMAPGPTVEHVRGFGRPALDWNEIEQGIREHGIRNACTLTYAPTGTISNVADCEGSGIECFFAIVFERKVMESSGSNKVFEVLHYASRLFEQALEDCGFDEERQKAIIEQVAAEGGSCQHIGDLPEWVKDSFVVAADLTPSEHIVMQAAAQAWVDNSISKTINMPNDATVADVQDAYGLAFALGCKGITVYRQGSRSLEVLSTTKKAETAQAPTVLVELPQDPQEVITALSWPIITPMGIPDEAYDQGLPTRTFPVKTAFGTLQVYVTEHPRHPGRPFDCRISIGKHGSDKNADVEALARMISISLRAGVDVTAVVDQLKGIGGRTFNGFGPNKVLSVADGVGKLLERLYLVPRLEAEVEAAVHAPTPIEVMPATVEPLGEVAFGSTCPNCHNASLVFEAGCLHCDTRLGGCGEYSGCD